MSVMGFKKKKLDGGWGELYPIFLDFLNFFNFAQIYFLYSNNKPIRCV